MVHRARNVRYGAWVRAWDMAHLIACRACGVRHGAWGRARNRFNSKQSWGGDFAIRSTDRSHAVVAGLCVSIDIQWLCIASKRGTACFMHYSFCGGAAAFCHFFFVHQRRPQRRSFSWTHSSNSYAVVPNRTSSFVKKKKRGGGLYSLGQVVRSVVLRGAPRVGHLYSVRVRGTKERTRCFSCQAHLGGFVASLWRTSHRATVRPVFGADCPPPTAPSSSHYAPRATPPRGNPVSARLPASY